MSFAVFQNNIFTRVQLPPPKPQIYLFHVAVTSKEDEKDVLTKTPDFIGGFRCLCKHFIRCRIIDVKQVFSLCGEFRTQTKLNTFTAGAWNKKSMRFFLYTQSYKSTYNAYTEYRFDINGENDANILGILVHGKIPIEIDTVAKHPAVVALLQSLKAE